MRTQLLTSMIGLLTVLLSTLAFAADYYVNGSGSDDNSGAEAAPLASIAKAAMLARPGDTVWVAPGVYVGRIRPAYSGTAETPIVYRRHGDGEVVITTSVDTDGGSWHERFAFKLGEGINYTTIDGFTFRDAEAWIYIGDGAHHNIVTNCLFDGCRIYHGIFINSGSYNTVRSSRFARATALPEDFPVSWRGAPGNLADYIAIWRNSHSNLVEDCRFGKITHVAVTVMGHDPDSVATRNIIRRCTFEDVMWKCIGSHASEHTLVEDNVMTGKAATFMQWAGAKGIIRRNRAYGYKMVRPDDIPLGFSGVLWFKAARNEYGSLDIAQHNRIYNNVFYGNDRAVTWTQSRSEYIPVCENVFVNNILYGNAQTIRLPLPFYAHFTTQRPNYLFNNLIASADPATPPIELCTSTESVTMSIDEAPAKTRELCRRTLAADNIAADPQFVDAAAADFHLKASSPCIDAGRPLTRTVEAGRGTVVPVADALYFHDGYGMIAPDRVQVGTHEPASVVRIDYDHRTLTLDRPITWSKGDPVSLPYTGNAPDLGVYEAGQ